MEQKGRGGPGSPPSYDRKRVEDVREGVLPTGNQQPQFQDLMHERAHLILRGRQNPGTGTGRGGRARKNPRRDCRSETENKRVLGEKNRKRRKYSVEIVDSNRAEQDGNEKAERRAQVAREVQTKCRGNDFSLVTSYRVLVATLTIPCWKD